MRRILSLENSLPLGLWPCSTACCLWRKVWEFIIQVLSWVQLGQG